MKTEWKLNGMKGEGEREGEGGRRGERSEFNKDVWIFNFEFRVWNIYIYTYVSIKNSRCLER